MLKHKCLTCGSGYASEKGAADCRASHGRPRKHPPLSTLQAAAPAMLAALKALTTRLDAEVAYSYKWPEFLNACKVIDAAEDR